MSCKCNEDTYKDQLAKFRQKYNSGYLPPKNWFSLVEDSHQNIRSFIGGTRKEETFQFEDNDPIIRDFEKIKAETNKIKEILPNYFADFGFIPGTMCHPMIPKTTSGNERFEGMKWGTHIMHYARNHKVEKSKQEELIKVISVIGSKWALEKTKKVKLKATLTTEPIGFLMLGHYNCDSQSCFRSGSSNEIHKYVLGQTPNSYSGIIAPAEEEKDCCDLERKNVGRFWGVANDDFTVFNLNNVYVISGYPRGNVLKSIEQLIQSVLGTDKIKIHEKQLSYTMVYHNKPNETWSICSQHYNKFAPQNIKENIGIFVSYGSCAKCFILAAKNSFISTNAGYLCKDCCDAFVKCEYCSNLYSNDTYLYKVDVDGENVKVCNSCVSSYLVLSGLTKKYIKRVNAFPLSEGGYCSLAEVTQFKLHKCKCGFYSKNEECLRCSMTRATAESIRKTRYGTAKLNSIVDTITIS